MTFSKKPVLLFGMPRSGTTPIYLILAEYLKQTKNTQRLHEYFNLYNASYEKINGVIVEYVHQNFSSKKRLCPDLEAKIIGLRIGLIDECPEKYFLKVVSSQLVPSLMTWLEQRYDWIFVERKNLREHFLSFAISVLSGVWYSKSGGIQIPEKSLVLKSSTVDNFKNCYFNYLIAKKKIRPKHILHYEDFEDNMTASAVLPALGIDMAGVDLRTMYTTSRQNEGDKMRYFSNPKEVENFISDLKFR